MSLNPPPPFEPCSQTNYANLYEMITSIVGFVTASTQLVSSLRNSHCCFSDYVRITEVIGDGEKNGHEVYNITDFPWFLQQLDNTLDVKIPLQYHAFKDVPLIQFPKYDKVSGEPNLQPRSITLKDTMYFGDVTPGSTCGMQSQNQSSFNSISYAPKWLEPQNSDISNQSCYFQEYTDSEQTIDSANLQENFETLEEIDDEIKSSKTKSNDSSINYLANEKLSDPHPIDELKNPEEAKVCTIYESCNAEPDIQDVIVLESHVEKEVVIESNYPFNSKIVEIKEEGVNANREISNAICPPNYCDYDMSVRDTLEKSADQELENIKECAFKSEKYCERTDKSKRNIESRVQYKSKEVNLKVKNKRENNFKSDSLSDKVNRIKNSVEKIVLAKSKARPMSIEKKSEKHESTNKIKIRKNKNHVQECEDIQADFKKRTVSFVPGEKGRKVKPEDDKNANKPINEKVTRERESKRSNRKLKAVPGFSGNYSEEPVDFVTKNIVNCLNLQKKLRKTQHDKQKSVGTARSRPQSNEQREKCNELKTISPSMNMVVTQLTSATSSGKKPVEKKNLSADVVKTLPLHEKTHITLKKNETKPTIHKDKPSVSIISAPVDIFKYRVNSPDVKFEKKNNSEPIKSCILKEDQCKFAHPKRPLTCPINTSLRIIPKLPLIKDQTLKLTAANTLKKAEDLLKTVDEKVLRATTAAKLRTASVVKRERPIGIK